MAFLFIIIIILISLILFVALFYHSLFKADYRPGMNSMPFLWYPIVTSIHGHSKAKLAIPATYIVDLIFGLCKVFEKQKIMCINVLGRRYVYLYHAETVEAILSSTKIVEKSLHSIKMKPMMKDGLFMSKGKKWQSRRKMLTSTFHFKILQDFVPLVRKTAKDVLPKLYPSPDTPWINIMDIMKAYSLDVFMQTALGVEVDAQAEATINCFNAIERYNVCNSERATRPWIEIYFRFTALSKISQQCIDTVHSFLLNVIEEKKKRESARQNQLEKVNDGKDKSEHEKANSFLKKRKPKAFMDLLLELHMKDESFTEENILEETLSFFLGATVATVNSLAYCMYMIGLYKDVQKKIQDELHEIFGNSDREITEEDIKSMKYLECVIKEAMRLHPLTFVGRSAIEDVKVCDYTIPKNSIIVIFTYVLHRDPKVFPDPEKFDPSRFFPENCQGRPPYAYVPFSAGPRNCIAQKFAMLELKIVFATILRKFNAHSLDERDKIHRLSETFPLRMRFTPRTTFEKKVEQTDL